MNVPDKWWEFSEYSIGIDVNVNGWGSGFNIGAEKSLNFHFGKNSLDLYANVFGRIGGKWSTLREDGSSSYVKFELNGPEIVASVVLIYFAWPYIAGILKGTGGLVPIPG